MACSGRCSCCSSDGATHVGVASDHVIESFRNDLWPGYKTSAGMPPELLGPVPGARGGARADGRDRVADGRVRGRRRAGVGRGDRRRRRRRVDQVVDLHARQGSRPVRRRRPRRAARSAQGRRLRRGRRAPRSSASTPESIPDYLALVGDTADGFPGLPGWGAKTAAAVLARYEPPRGHPAPPARVGRAACASAAKLATTLRGRTSTWRCCSVASPPSSSTCPSAQSTSWRWTGPTDEFVERVPSGSARRAWSERAIATGGATARTCWHRSRSPSRGRRHVSPDHEPPTRRTSRLAATTKMDLVNCYLAVERAV